MTKSVPLEKRTPHKGNSDKMTTLEKLTKDRAVAKGRVTVYINSLNALLATEGPEAQSANIKADDDLKKLDVTVNLENRIYRVNTRTHKEVVVDERATY